MLKGEQVMVIMWLYI